jgi:hypothetical protein
VILEDFLLIIKENGKVNYEEFRIFGLSLNGKRFRRSLKFLGL